MTVTPINRRVEGILEESRKLEFLGFVQWLITAIFYGIGWTISKALTVAWRIVAFMWVAAAAGYTEAKKKGG